MTGFVNEARQNGLVPSQELAKYFGLKVAAANPKAANTRVNQNAGVGAKVKDTALSATTGFAKAYGGVAQLYNKGKDVRNKAVNNAVGTNLSTNNLSEYNQNVKNMDSVVAESRRNAGRSGFNVSELIGEVAATAPAFVLGGAPGVGLRGAATVAAKEGAIGAGLGAVRYAKDGDERKSNTIYGGAGGAVGGVVGNNIVAPVAKWGGRKIVRRTANKTGNTATAAAKLVDDAIEETGIKVGATARAGLVDDATKALSKGRQVDAGALVRKNLLERHGVKGTQAQITRDPGTWGAEREAAKQNPQLNNVHIENHQQLDEMMKKLVDDTGATPVDTPQKMTSTFKSLKQADEAAQEEVSRLYDAAREMSGNDAQLNHLRFIDQASRELEENGVGSFMKGDIRGIFKGMFDDPDFKLTHAKAEEINKVLNARLRTTTDGNERHAIGIIKNNLQKEIDNTIDDMSGLLGNGPSDGGLAGARDAWQTARGAARERFQTLENTPALKAAADGMEPNDNDFAKYILRGNAADIVRTIEQLKKVPGGEQNIKDLQGAAIEHFLSKSQNNAGAFSPHQLNRALESFGNQRMKALFTTEQIARLNDIKQVADILVQQPLGAHVNHSNTANVLIKQLLGVVDLAGKIPVVGNAAVGAVGALGNLAKGGAAAKMINGQVPVTKGSSLGLTPEQLRKLGLLSQGVTGTTAATGANLPN